MDIKLDKPISPDEIVHSFGEKIKFTISCEKNLKHSGCLEWFHGRGKWALRFSGLPGEIRTLDPLLRRQLLYPAELQGVEE